MLVGVFSQLQLHLVACMMEVEEAEEIWAWMTDCDPLYQHSAPVVVQKVVVVVLTEFSFELNEMLVGVFSQLQLHLVADGPEVCGQDANNLVVAVYVCMPCKWLHIVALRASN